MITRKAIPRSDTDTSPQSLEWIHALRSLAVLAVVAIHTAAPVMASSEIGSFDWWTGNAVNSVLRWSVPFFVMISGALLLAPGKEEAISAFYAKRASKILVPLVFWSVFYTLFVSFKSLVKAEPTTISQLLINLAHGVPYYHMWFLFMIAALYLVTPFLRIFTKHATDREVLHLMGLMFALSVLNEIYLALTSSLSNQFFPTRFLQYLPYFLCGHYFQRKASRLPKRTLIAATSLAMVFTMVGTFGLSSTFNWSIGQYFYTYSSITTIPAAICLFHLLKNIQLPKRTHSMIRAVSGFSFGIYLIHPVFLEMFSYLGHGPTAVTPVVSIPLLTTVVFLLSCVAVGTISRIPFLNRII